MTPPLVSCLVIVHDQARFLEHAVASALAQDDLVLEVLVAVEGGAGDAAAGQAEALATRHPDRVRVVRAADAGPTAALNAALGEARGELLAFLDADDVWLPDKLRTQVELLAARPDVGLVYTDLAVIDDEYSVVTPSLWDDRGMRPLDGRCAGELIAVGNTAATSTVLVRASLREVFWPIPDGVPYADWWIAFRVACAADLAYVRQALTGYRQERRTETSDDSSSSLLRALRDEHLFRRAALARLDRGVFTVAEMAAGYEALERSARTLMGAAGSVFETLPPGAPEAAAEELAAAAVSTAAPVTALRHLLRAAALDPWNAEARSAFVELAQSLSAVAGRREESPAGPDFLALGFLDELLISPDMLDEYVRTFAGRKDSRLVILAPGADPAALEQQLAPLAESLGLDREDSAEIVVVTDPRAGEQLARSAAAVYTRISRNSYLEHLPQLATAAALAERAPAVAVLAPDFRAVAFLDEMLASPDLLADYARAFDGRRDAELILHAPAFAGAEEELERHLGPLAEALGLDRDGSARVVVLTDPEAGPALATSAAAVYTRQPHRDYGGMPRATDAGELLCLADGRDRPSFHAPSLLAASPPWASAALAPETIPGMITDEEKRYFRWIGASFSGAGAVVELGPWLGCSTSHIVAGLERSPAFAGSKLHVYDDFVWRSSWMDGYYDLPDRPENHGDFRPIFDRYATPIADRIEVAKVKFADFDGNESLPALEWQGGAVEILYVDCGRTFEANEAWWRVFEPHFIPGKTLVIMQDWQLYKEQPPQWYNQTKEFTDSKGDALELVHELRDGAIGTFLYHGQAAVELVVRESGWELLLRDQPKFHQWQGEPISWNNGNPGIVERFLRPGMVTLETGAGYSTVVFAAAGCEHIAVTPEQIEADRIATYCREHGYQTPTFHVGPSQDVLPRLERIELDAAFIDGAHAFPFPMLDWFYADRLLKIGGLLFVDDLQLMACFLLDRFLARDRCWTEIHREGNLAVYRKVDAYDFPHDYWAAQAMCAEPVEDLESFLSGIWPEAVGTSPKDTPMPMPAPPAPQTPPAPKVSIGAPRRAADDARPSYLLLTYDSCRLDVLQEAATPVLDSYAPIVAAQTPANFTYAAHQAFFVGMLPNALEPIPFYNRFVNQLFALGSVGEIQVVEKACAHRVGSDVNLVAGLGAAGYQTVGSGAMNWFKQKALTQWFEKFAYTGTDAEQQIAFLRREIDPSRPFFGFINFGETHDPFDFAGKPDRCPIEVQSRLITWPPAENGLPVGRACLAWEHQKRSAEYLDSKLPSLFDGLPGHTVVILCGDHGEAFGEDGYWGHGVNHPTVLTVPMAIFRLDRAPL